MIAPLIDTHAHLAATQFKDELPEIVARASSEGVERIISIGSDLDDSRRNLEIADQFPGVFATVGIHPTSVHEINESNWLDRIRSMTEHPKVLAIGEIGLDFFHPPADGSSDEEWKSLQERFFRSQLDLAAELDLPVVIHQRECFAEVTQILADYSGRIRAVLHCFTGNPDQLSKIIAAGHFVSFTGITTFPKATDVQASAIATPANRLMVETDSPYLAPVPHRGKRCEPAFVRYTAEHIAMLREISIEDLAELSSENAQNFFRIPEKYQLSRCATSSTT